MRAMRKVGVDRMNKATRTWVLTSVGFGAGWGTYGALWLFGAPTWVMVAVGAVSFALLVWAQWPAPRPEPIQPDDDTLREWMSDYLERHRLGLITNEIASALKGTQVVDSPHMPGGQVIVMRPELREMLFRQLATPPPSLFPLAPSPFFPKDIDKAMAKAFDVRANDEMMAKAFRECGVHWGAPEECVRGVEGIRCQHTCVAPTGHEVGDDFPHGCYCGATLSQSINPATGKVWCWCARLSCEGCPE